MRTRSWLLLGALLLTSPAAAKEPKCPLDLATCLAQFEHMRDRPWLGVHLDPDSTGHSVVVDVGSGTPAQKAGLRPGDVLESIENRPPSEWFAGKAGWKNGDSGVIKVTRAGRTQNLTLRYEKIPEDVLAKAIGTHMIEGHLAYMHPGSETESH
ncbi:MAG: PDZ domain-containing protein [Candidatus Eisenbacteria bacterium]|uniref:PDZ domain-containing protein n=1 Tax=Eiseniibacteriota bacterium TaxID=2212470 RepID=A0A538U1G6_UNCEI|nr:MAG: PDZ domain-containing protein [Candidatus Eisenbacteria bacterium]